MTRPTARIGCSGWLDKDWRGTFYPARLPQRCWLPFYATRFDTVELNGTFYRLPEAGEVFGVEEIRAPQLSVRHEGEPVPDTHEEADRTG